MRFLVSLLVFVASERLSASSACRSNATLSTYYPCSSTISSPTIQCQYLSTSSSIDQCTNREMIFFWHYPVGQMTLTLYSEKQRPFSLWLFTRSLSKKTFIEHISHVMNNETVEQRLIHKNGYGLVTLHSDDDHQCSIKIETSNRVIFDYGLFIRLMIWTDDNDRR